MSDERPRVRTERRGTVLAIVLGALGVWMLAQPMDMRAVGAFG